MLPGTLKISMLFLVLVLKLNIQFWLILLPKCYGFTLSFMTWLIMSLSLQCKCVMTIKMLSLLLKSCFPWACQRYRGWLSFYSGFVYAVTDCRFLFFLRWSIGIFSWRRLVVSHTSILLFKGFLLFGMDILLVQKYPYSPRFK